MRYRKYYPTVSEAFDYSHPTPGSTIDYSSMFFLFKNNHLFDGTLTYIDEDGETQHYPAVGAINNSGDNKFTPANLLSYFTRKYDERRLGFPAKGITPFSSEAEKEEAIKETITKFNLYVESFTAAVEYKYLELLKTTADAYNPLTGLKEIMVIQSLQIQELVMRLTVMPAQIQHRKDLLNLVRKLLALVRVILTLRQRPLRIKKQEQR